ncbi:cell wall-binding repeat-containing protein [Schumannella luteola]
MTRTAHRFAVAVGALALVAASVGAASPAAAVNGTITGTVTSESSALPIQNVVAEVWTLSGTWVNESTTDASGQFQVSVPPGDYHIQFSTIVTPAFVPEWSGDVLFESDATTVTVSDGGTAVADAALESGKTISGSIMSPSSQPGYFVVQAFAWDATGGVWSRFAVDSVIATPSMTAYTLQRLSSKVEYRLLFSYDCSVLPCIPLGATWYDGASSLGDALDVAAGSTDIDATLSPIPIDRIAGADRFETAALLADEFDPAEVDTVYLSNGLNFPDALSAAPAAAITGAPLLLTAPDFLPETVADSLEALDPERVVITGTEASVSAAVEDAVADLLPGATIDRLGGADRFETSRLVIADAFPTGATELWVATGYVFADALSAAPVAGRDGAPVLLVNGPATTLDASTAAFIEDLGVTTVRIAGGTPSVSAALESAIDALPGVSVVRYAGSDRYDTSRAINQNGWDDNARVFLASGLTFPDALAGSALAGGLPAPLYIVPGTCVTPGVLSGVLMKRPSSITVLGGPTTVSPAAENLTSC